MNLDHLKQTRRALQGTAVAAAHAVERARQRVADEVARVREGERRLDAARDRPTYDAECAALEDARKDHALAIKRLTDRQGERAHAEAQARDAEAQVVEAVDQTLTDEIAERAEQVQHHLSEALRLGTALRYFAVAAGIHSTKIISPSTLGVLDRLYLPLVDPLDVPINLAQLGDVAAFREWAARRAAMIDAEGETSPLAA